MQSLKRSHICTGKMADNEMSEPFKFEGWDVNLGSFSWRGAYAVIFYVLRS